MCTLDMRPSRNLNTLQNRPPGVSPHSPMRAPDPGSSATREPAILEARVIRAVVRELPPEHVPVEAPRVGDARGGHFGGIDASILLGVVELRPWWFRRGLGSADS